MKAGGFPRSAPYYRPKNTLQKIGTVFIHRRNKQILAGRASVPASIIRTGWKAYANHEELFGAVPHEPLALSKP
jgi:hypothetical protein